MLLALRMQTIDHLRDLFAFNAWANRAAAISLATTPDPKGIRALAHLLQAEWTWIERIHGDGSRTGAWQELSLEECRRLLDEGIARFEAYLMAIDEADLDRDIAYRSFAGVEQSTPLRQILTHVALHGMYHRGQIAQAVRAAGGDPAATDYITYVRLRS
jgi:uncharacterized damage-inducible protein DinB